MPPASSYDFTAGYHLARELRATLKNTANQIDIESLIDDLGIPIRELRMSDESLDGGCVCDDDHGPVIFLNPDSPRAAVKWGRRMVLAHEFCHLLFDRHAAVGIGMVSGPWAPPRIERRANAFAIELLLPLQGVLRTVGRAWESPSDEDIETLMNEFELGVTAVTKHVWNLGDPRNR